MTMTELPEDLLEEILSRVPATSLKRLRFTCKRWNRLFNDKRFTRMHFDKAPKQFLFILLNNHMFCSISINLHKAQAQPQKVTDEVSLTDLHSRLDQIMGCQVFHCDGLLLCITREDNPRLLVVVWNPCTGQTRWINDYMKYTTYALGSYQEKISSNDNSYKILWHNDNHRFAIFKLNSNSWRILDVTLDFQLPSLHRGVSLKGKTYWIARNEKELDAFLISFDYTTEIFERLCLPPQYPSYKAVSLSTVREEKLTVLLKHHFTQKIEVWVTSKIGETKAASWSKVLVVDLNTTVYLSEGGCFLVNEEKKVLVCCNYYNTIYIAGENNNVGKVKFGVEATWCPFLFNYVPSLSQI